MESEARIITRGTLRPQDLLESFASCLDGLEETKQHDELIEEAYALANHIEFGEEDTYQEIHGLDIYEAANEVLEDLEEALNNYAPEGYYFGTDPNTPDEKGWLPIEEDE